MVKTKKQLDMLTKFILSEDPDEKAMLEKRLRRMVGSVEDTQTTIKGVLREIGVPTNILGYHYLARAIEMHMNAHEPVQFTKGCYADIAKEFGTTWSRVERGMRHGVERAMEIGDPDVVRRYFGNTIDPNKGKPVLTQFITRMAEAVQEAQNG